MVLGPNPGWQGVDGGRSLTPAASARRRPSRPRGRRQFVNPLWLKLLAYTVAVIIGALNIWLLFQFFSGSVS